MSLNASQPSPRLPARRVAILITAAFLRLATACASAAQESGTGTTTIAATPAAPVREVAPGVLTEVRQLWTVPESESNMWHRVSLNYVVYHYDGQWSVMWGRDDGGESYLWFDPKAFPVKPGQRLHVEGLMHPTNHLRVEDPVVTLLQDAVPLEPISPRGHLGDYKRFDQHFVEIEGTPEDPRFVDTTHVIFNLFSEGRAIQVRVVLHDETLPPLAGSMVRIRGVYLQPEPSEAVPRISLLVNGAASITKIGSVSTDPQFAAVPTPIAQLAPSDAGTTAHVIGELKSREPGKSLLVREGASDLLVFTEQTTPLEVGEKIDVAGRAVREGEQIVLRDAMYRKLQLPITNYTELEKLDAKDPHPFRVRFNALVYFYDPYWKVLWAGIDGRIGYLSLRTGPLPLVPGERVLIEGTVKTGENVRDVLDPKVTPLAPPLALEAVPTGAKAGDVEKLDMRFVLLEGYVDRQETTDAQHLTLDIVTGDRTVVGRVLLKAGQPIPELVNRRIRIKGACAATPDVNGGVPVIELWCPGLEYLENVAALADDPRFGMPATSMDRLASAPPGQLVRVVGSARAQEPGRSITLRDETGQVEVRTPQTVVIPFGQPVEAIGIPVQEGAFWALRSGLYRRTRLAPQPPDSVVTTLRLTDQLRELSPENAARGIPVKLAGVVTWARANADYFFLHDATGGVRVYRPANSAAQYSLGRRVEVTGVSAPGPFTPVVLAESVAGFSSIDLPEPHTITLDQALTGSEESQWVSMTGFVRTVEDENPWVRIVLSTPDGEFTAMLAPNDRWQRLPGSVVRVRGVCSAVANSKRQLTGICVWVPASRLVEVEEPAPENPFALPQQSLGSLSQFNALPRANRRVRVTGTVTYHERGRIVHIQDGTEAGVVLSRDDTPLSPGDRIDVVGFPGRENGRVVLREAVFRRLAGGAAVVPVELQHVSTADRELEGRLVRLEAVLTSVGSYDKGTRLIVQSQQFFLEALLEQPGDKSVPASWQPGTRLALTGVYEIQYDEYRQPHSLRLLLRSPADVQIVLPAPWWTVRRALGATAILALGSMLGFGWVVALRRRVRHQTGVIRQQVENERAARLEAALARASKLESLGVLAGGIAHDFNNLLTVVMGNLSLARLDPKIEAETVHCIKESERAAMRARDLTRQLLTFAKGGAPMKASTHLPEIVREAADFALHGAKARCEFHFDPDLWAADVDKAQIGQVVHNLIINANEAMKAGGTIQVVLANEEVAQTRGALAAGRYVRLTLTDSGAGISPEIVARIFDPYFTTKKNGSGLGLATVYSIIKKHQGHVEVSSQLGQGTTFTLWLPAAVEEPAPHQETAKAAPRTTAKAGRVLLMDDEAPIRMLGATVLKRMGFEVTAVNDGSAAVSEYASATAAGKPFDLVILDLTVPGGMGGSEAMERLRAMDAGVRAIVSSGYSSDPVMANYQRHGFSGRVPKPYVVEDLTTVVKKVLDLESTAAK